MRENKSYYVSDSYQSWETNEYFQKRSPYFVKRENFNHVCEDVLMVFEFLLYLPVWNAVFQNNIPTNVNIFIILLLFVS